MHWFKLWTKRCHALRGGCAALALVIGALTAIAAITAPAGAQTVFYVDDDAPAGGTGSAWTVAFNSIQAALDAATGLPEQEITVRVAQGRYVPTLRSDPADPRSATFQLRYSLALEGGYAGLGAPDPDARDPELYASILSGDINGDDQPNFVNYFDNARRIVRSNGTDETALINGFRISGAGQGTGLYNNIGSPTIEGCVFTANLGGAMTSIGPGSPVVRDSRFLANAAWGQNAGGAVYYSGSSALFEGCLFEGNTAGGPGGAVYCREAEVAYLSDCEFRNNVSTIGGGGAVIGVTPTGAATILRCTFAHNWADEAGGGLIVDNGSAIIKDCVFRRNDAGFIGGGSIIGCPTAVVTNSIFVGNGSVQPGGGIAASDSDCQVANCSFTANAGAAIGTWAGILQVNNCILWGDAQGEIVGGNGSVPNATVSFSDIQGGWSGSGSNNIDLNPLFFQPGCDNLRLAYGSPCIDAGSNALIPPGVTSDLDGNPRIQNGVVDMGAYEGGHDPLPPTACAENIANGEEVRLVPTGGAFNPMDRAAVDFINMNGPDHASAMATQFMQPMHPGGGGYNELGDAMNVQTSLPDGELFMRVVIPFDQSNLNGFDPLGVDVTFFLSVAGTWLLGAAGNIQNSPGHAGPLGDRIVVQGTGSGGAAWGWTWEVGDYGVFWNPDLQNGFAWANVDHAGADFAFGVPLPACVGDCAYPSDGTVDHADVAAVIGAWGVTPAGPASFADINRDGFVNVNDLLLVLNSWGPCPGFPRSPAVPGVPGDSGENS